MKAVVLLSGGIDSTTCLAIAVNRFGPANVTALTMYYGQKHSKELLSAKAVAQHYEVQHFVRNLESVFELSDSPLLKSSDEAIPEGDYATQIRDADGMAKTYVPFRNGLFLSYATAIAYSIGAEFIFYGAHADDAAGNAYPDCSEKFYESMNAAIWEGTGKKVIMSAPLISMNKATVINTGLELNAPYELTWSCYNGDLVACGKCGTCLDRIHAFELNGAVDPIPYEVL